MQIGRLIVRRSTLLEDRVPSTRGGNDGNDDAVQPGQRAAGVGDVVSDEREPANRYVQRKTIRAFYRYTCAGLLPFCTFLFPLCLYVFIVFPGSRFSIFSN